MNAAVYINQSSKITEYYTPIEIIEAARKTMGNIDLDPASSEMANRIVKADWYFTEADNGLSKQWHGNVWMNHPFSREGNPRWIKKLVGQHLIGNVPHACCITYACTSETWFQPLYKFPLCFLSPRTNYRLPDGSIKRGVTKGSVVTYLGPNVYDFALAFEKLGSVMMPYESKVQP